MHPLGAQGFLSGHVIMSNTPSAQGEEDFDEEPTLFWGAGRTASYPQREPADAGGSSLGELVCRSMAGEPASSTETGEGDDGALTAVFVHNPTTEMVVGPAARVEQVRRDGPGLAESGATEPSTAELTPPEPTLRSRTAGGNSIPFFRRFWAGLLSSLERLLGLPSRVLGVGAGRKAATGAGIPHSGLVRRKEVDLP
jgi:hypothetical protein